MADIDMTKADEGPALLAPLTTLGAVTSILLASPMHRHVFLAEMEWLVVPAVSLGQCRVFHHQSVPVAFATWAYLNDEATARFKQGAGRLKPHEWHCGEELWLVELCAPYGAVTEHIQDLLQTTFDGKTVRTMRPTADGTGVEESTLEAMLTDMTAAQAGPGSVRK